MYGDGQGLRTGFTPSGSTTRSVNTQTLNLGGEKLGQKSWGGGNATGKRLTTLIPGNTVLLTPDLGEEKWTGGGMGGKCVCRTCP